MSGRSYRSSKSHQRPHRPLHRSVTMISGTSDPSTTAGEYEHYYEHEYEQHEHVHSPSKSQYPQNYYYYPSYPSIKSHKSNPSATFIGVPSYKSHKSNPSATFIGVPSYKSMQQCRCRSARGPMYQNSGNSTINRSRSRSTYGPHYSQKSRIASTISGEKPSQRQRINPRTYHSKLPNDNLPDEAAAPQAITTAPVSQHNSDFRSLIRSDVHTEMSAENMRKLVGTNIDPEQYLIPANNKTFLDREVNAQKLIDLIVRYMEGYYDMNDHDAFSERRHALDDHLWDTTAYLAPLVCRQAINVLHNEPLIVTTEPDALVFGDIHGNLTDIYYIYTHFISNPRYANHRFIFLGDYVDRGPKSYEVILLLLAYKLSSPNRFVLLRGNHECEQVNARYGFKHVTEHVFSETFISEPGVMGPFIYSCFNKVFGHLPVAAVVRGIGNKTVFCCHGGVPDPELKRDIPSMSAHNAWTVAELNSLTDKWKPSPLEPSKRAPPQHKAINEILWNDPIPRSIRSESHFQRDTFYQNKKRGGHCSFYTEAGLTDFLHINHLNMVIRGHQYKFLIDTGYAFDFGEKLLTVFSSSNYCGTQHNVTGYVELFRNGAIVPHVLRTLEDSSRYADFNILQMRVDKTTGRLMEIIF